MSYGQIPGSIYPTNGLIAYYSFEDGAVRDRYGNNQGTVAGGAKFVGGSPGNAILLSSGASQWVTTGLMGNWGGQWGQGITIIMKYKSPTNGYGVITGMYSDFSSQGYLFTVNRGPASPAGAMWTIIRDSTGHSITAYMTTGSPLLYDNNFHIIACVTDPVALSHKFYIDGVNYPETYSSAQAQGSGYGNLSWSWAIGAGGDPSGPNSGIINGTIDEYRIYSRTMAATEIAGLSVIKNPKSSQQ